MRLTATKNLLSTPRAYNLKRLKWRGIGIEKVMADVYHQLGENEGSSELASSDPRHDRKGERLRTWENLIGTLMECFADNKTHHSATRYRMSTRTSSHNPWFNYALRKQKSQLVRKIRSVSNLIKMVGKPDRSELKNLRKQYNKNCREAKTTHRVVIWNKLLMASKQRNGKHFWYQINALTLGKNRHQNAWINEDAWVAHIMSLYKEPNSTLVSYTAKKDRRRHAEQILQTAPEDINVSCKVSVMKSSSSDKLTQVKQLTKIIKKLNSEGAPGPNGIPNALFKGEAAYWAKYFTTLFNELFKTNEIPESWRGSIIQPIFKGGNPSKPKNYRLIALLDVVAKLYASCLLVQLKTWSDDHKCIPRSQTGFRTGAGTLTNLTALTLLIEKSTNSCLFTCFVDLKQAFDSMPRKRLWEKLARWGIPKNLLSAIRELYSSTWSRVKLGDGRWTSKKIHTKNGLKQGCVPAPTLFNLYISDLEDALVDTNSHPPSLANEEIRCLQYADDLVILSQTPIGLQRGMNALAKYLSAQGLELNLLKTKVVRLVDAKNKNKKFKWHIEGRNKVVASYKYLGFQVERKRSYKSQLISMRLKSQNLIHGFNVLKKKLSCPLYGNLLTVMRAQLTPSVTYGTEIMKGREIPVLNKIQTTVYKKVFQIQQSASPAQVRLEFGLLNQEFRCKGAFMKLCWRLQASENGTMAHLCWKEIDKIWGNEGRYQGINGYLFFERNAFDCHLNIQYFFRINHTQYIKHIKCKHQATKKSKNDSTSYINQPQKTLIPQTQNIHISVPYTLLGEPLGGNL